MAQLIPSPKFRAVGADGLALVGGKLFTYVAGSSTPKATYADQGLASPNANPVILNSRGEADVWLDGNYKVVLTTAADVVVWTVDNIRDITSSPVLAGVTLASGLVVSAPSVTWATNTTHSGNHAWNGTQTFNSNVTIGDTSADTLTVAPNLVTWTNNPTHSGNHTFGGNVTVAGTLTGGYSWTAFTPTILFTVSAVGVTYSIDRAAQYALVGKLCFFNIRMALSAKGSSTGPVYISNLPVAPSLGNNAPVCSVQGLGMTGLTGSLGGQILTSSIAITQSTATGNASITDANVTNTSEIYLSGFYPVA